MPIWFVTAGMLIDQATDWLATNPATLRPTCRKLNPAYLRGAMSALDLY